MHILCMLSAEKQVSIQVPQNIEIPLYIQIWEFFPFADRFDI